MFIIHTSQNWTIPTLIYFNWQKQGQNITLSVKPLIDLSMLRLDIRWSQWLSKNISVLEQRFQSCLKSEESTFERQKIHWFCFEEGFQCIVSDIKQSTSVPLTTDSKKTANGFFRPKGIHVVTEERKTWSVQSLKKPFNQIFRLFRTNLKFGNRFLWIMAINQFFESKNQNINLSSTERTFEGDRAYRYIKQLTYDDLQRCTLSCKV